MGQHPSTWTDEHRRLWLFQQSFTADSFVQAMLRANSFEGHLVYMYEKTAGHPLHLGDTVELRRGTERLAVDVHQILESRGSMSGFKYVLSINVV
jgi:hypothetical protein